MAAQCHNGESTAHISCPWREALVGDFSNHLSW
jgi:hypothetical protein